MQTTMMMDKVGFSWIDVNDVVEHVIRLLESQGDTAVAIVRRLLKLVKAVTDRDLLAIFTLLNDTVVDVKKVIAAVKAEFGL